MVSEFWVERRGWEQRAMRRAAEATGHKTASAYGYAIHTKPQGFIIRPPLLTDDNMGPVK